MQIFQSTRLSRASTKKFKAIVRQLLFQSTRLSRASTPAGVVLTIPEVISIHKALASLDGFRPSIFAVRKNFNPQGSREPRRQKVACLKVNLHFNPQGSREPRPRGSLRPCRLHSYFNPQGSREPRLIIRDIPGNSIIFQSTRLSRASTAKLSKPAPHPP